MTETRDEGDIGADYIETLLDIADMDGDIDIDESERRTTLIVGEPGDESLAPLSDPDTVAALQELTRLSVQAKTGEFSRVVLDVAGSRDARARELEEMVDRAVASIEGGSDAVPLEPMSSYERKIVHDIVSARGYRSESEGEGRDRHTVVKAP
ncbi:MAG TPA: DNA-binding protein [Candidatus Agrococcus pullicola]|uniref:DNA-binding protein n=1 Tax=Candidatus Agrococcus pullicola TaxID=2838429 RepID=A0A9D1YS43_9MICO|nr:DNA-binding protein [Candidatus Agrococcus pullicola]